MRASTPAKQVFQKTEDWEDKVEPWLKLSKAVRTLVVPLVALLIYDVTGLWTFLNPAFEVKVLGYRVFSPLQAWSATAAVLPFSVNCDGFGLAERCS